MFALSPCAVAVAPVSGGGGGGGVFTDDFNRANENLEASDDWTRVGGSAGAASINSNILDINSSGAVYTCPDTGSTNHYAQAQFPNTGSSLSRPLAVRIVDEDNYVCAGQGGGAWEITKVLAGSATQLANAGTQSAGAVARLEVSGGNARLLIDSVEIIGWTSLGGDLSSSTLAGIACRHGNSAGDTDNFEAGAL